MVVARGNLGILDLCEFKRLPLYRLAKTLVGR